MAAAEILIADAIAAELNDAARDWDLEFTAVRTWMPILEVDDLDSLKVLVVPISLETVQNNRASLCQMDYVTGISIQRRVDVTLTTPLDDLADQAEAIHDWFRDAHRLATQTSYLVIGATREDIYDLERLYTEGVWETLINVTVRGHR